MSLFKAPSLAGLAAISQICYSSKGDQFFAYDLTWTATR
jgi:hypothetical protein